MASTRRWSGGGEHVTEVLLTAGQWAAMIAEPLRNRGYRLTKAGSFAEPFLAFKQLSGRAERTLADYEWVIARLCTLHPAKQLDEFTSDDLLQVIASYPRAQHRKVRSHLAEFFKWALIWDHITVNPMVRIPTIQAEPQTVIEIFNDAEEGALCSLPEIRDRALQLLLFGAGIRDGEARRVQREHVNLEERTLQVHGKGRRERLIPLPRRACIALADLFILDGINDEDFLWYRVKANAHSSRIRRDRPIVYSGFHGWWTRTLADAGVRARKPHTTRHTYATKYLRAGGRLERLSRILGHANVAITESFYAHMNVTDLAEDADFVMAVRRWEEI